MAIFKIKRRASLGDKSIGRLYRRWLGVLLLFAGCSLMWGTRTTAQPPTTTQSNQRELRVLCYNLQHGRGTDDRVDLERIAEVIRRAKPDLVALQEVDHRTRRTGRVDQTAELARLTGLHGKFVKQIDYEGGEYGQAILSRLPISDVEIHWLPGVPDRQRRIAGVVEVTIAGRPLLFATTHLHHANESFRIGQAERLNELFKDLPHPVILAGDLNAEPTSQPLATLKQVWTLAQQDTELKTFPAQVPTKQIDYVLFTPQDAFEVRSAEVLDEPLASDHRPLLVVLRRSIASEKEAREADRELKQGS